MNGLVTIGLSVDRIEPDAFTIPRAEILLLNVYQEWVPAKCPDSQKGQREDCIEVRKEKPSNWANLISSGDLSRIKGLECFTSGPLVWSKLWAVTNVDSDR